MFSWFLLLTSPSMTDATRRRAFALVSQAYTSIIADDFAAFVGLPVEEAVKGTWTCCVPQGTEIAQSIGSLFLLWDSRRMIFGI